MDLACKLREGVSTKLNTQEQLKTMVGIELESYRKSRGIKSELEPKHRCWRLEYQDELNFHMDIVPCIPANQEMQQHVFEAMRRYYSLNENLARKASGTAILITDDRHIGFYKICDDWNISNPEGYSAWFESRMHVEGLKFAMEAAQVDEVPLYKRKTPLQRCVQILKRHRDVMFKGKEDLKPISIIITTLAARAYRGEQNIAVALENILKTMDSFINKSIPRVPNPVRPEEDFADRWYGKDSSHLRLEDNFRFWLTQANSDFSHILSISDADYIKDLIDRKFALVVNRNKLAEKLRINGGAPEIYIPQKHSIDKSSTPQPWQI